MEQRIKTARETKRFRQKLFKGLRLGAAFLLVTLFTVLSLVMPLRSTLPAYKIAPREEGQLRVHFLSVGDGDCTIVEFPDGALVVIDAGDGGFRNGNRLLRYIKGLDYTSLTCIATEADINHFGGFIPLLNYYGADEVYLPVVSGNKSSYKKLEKAVNGADCAVSALSRYDYISNPSGAYIACVSPNSIDEEDSNDASAVLLLGYESVKFLFCGDITAQRERRLMREYALFEGVFDTHGQQIRLENISVLKTSAHGSASSSCEEWVGLLSPQWAVVSCGAGNRYKHPAAETISTLARHETEILRTDELGDIIFTVTNGNLSVERSNI